MIISPTEFQLPFFYVLLSYASGLVKLLRAGGFLCRKQDGFLCCEELRH